MDQRLRGEDLADRRGERRPARLRADRAAARRAPRRAGRRRRARAGACRARRRGPAGRPYSAARTAMRGASGVTGSSPMCSSTRSDACQSASTSTPVSRPEPVERRGERLAGDAVERERDRVDGAGDQVGAGARRLERRGERVAARALAVEADRAARSPRATRRRARARRCGCSDAGRVVDEDARGAELRQLARLLDERLGLARVARAVDEPGVELAAGGGDRLGRLAQVRDVVQRVVQAEDVDAVLGRRGDEAARRSRRRRAASRRGSGRAAPARAASSSAP